MRAHHRQPGARTTDSPFRGVSAPDAERPRVSSSGQPARSPPAIHTQSGVSGADQAQDGPDERRDALDDEPAAPPLTLRRALLRIGVVVVAVVAVLAAGAVNGVGPLARTTPPSQVTDPREMLARSVQSLIDASSVHVEATLSGQVPGALVGQAAARVHLDGTEATVNLRPQDARSSLTFLSPELGLEVDAITSWDTMSYSFDGKTWTKGSLGEVTAGSGIDIDPLTLVRRLRAWLGEPDASAPASTDVPCGAPSGTCRRVTLTLGPSAGRMLLRLLPASEAAAGATATDVVLLTDASTLRPSHLTLRVHNADGSLAATVEADFTLWDWPSVIADPPGN